MTNKGYVNFFGGGGGGGRNLGALWEMCNWRIVDAPVATTVVS